MPTSWRFVIELALSTVVVAVVCVAVRRSHLLAILTLSICAMGLQAVNLLIYFPERLMLPQLASMAALNAARSAMVTIDIYCMLAAWVLALFDAAQRNRFVWLVFITIGAAITLISFAIIGQPYTFFSRHDYTLGVSLLLIPPAHVSGLLTLVYSLVTWARDRRARYFTSAPMFAAAPVFVPPPMFIPPPSAPPVTLPAMPPAVPPTPRSAYDD